MLLLVFPSSSLSKEILIWLAILCLLGTAQRGDYSSVTHTHALPLWGPLRARFPGTKMGKELKSRVLKTLLFLTGHPRKGCTRSASYSLHSLSSSIRSPLLLLTPGSRACVWQRAQTGLLMSNRDCLPDPGASQLICFSH